MLRAAIKFGAQCVGVTISQNQYDLAVERVKEAGLEDRVEIPLQDYRDITGQFERITSVGMFEHVGLDNLPDYFSRLKDLLTEEGIAMNHGITSVNANSGETPLGGGNFSERYVFPQGELPHIGLVLKSMQQGSIEALDVENLRPHYARTLACWTERFEAQAETIREMVGEEVYRIWRVYFAGCAHAFDIDNLAIFQVVCRKAGQPSSMRKLSRRHMYS
ncbi:cyclopropane-fatty-acyl-phospholipid synthase family protein [uncultured Marinobacter sp.]|uniref:SAM-dependent methyltransferase n=1 Tax=uncultured Marinobacter sp. TaxID=187379 RepID=UPI0026277A3B|nr:cyclopropane-fatty-acyl-phospholipid synthase family protein [uncultured Marinobacter sp.]